MMFGLGSFNLINEFERAFNEPNAEHLASSSARLQPYIQSPIQFKTLALNLISVACKGHLKDISASTIKYALNPKAWQVLTKVMTLNGIKP